MSQYWKLVLKVMLLKNLANTNVCRFQEDGKANHDRSVRFEPVIVLSDIIFIAWTPMLWFSVERLAARGYKKILSRRRGPCLVIILGFSTLGFGWTERKTLLS